jgi:hypothetical protein
MRKNGVEMFEIIEEILENTVIEGLPEDNFFKNFVDYRNKKLGDQNSFYVPDKSLLIVSEIANGTSVLRRQRLDNGTSVSLKTSMKGIKIYEELDRLLAGRADFDRLMEALNKAFTQKSTDDAYTAFITSITSLPAAFKKSGSFDEDILVDLIDLVERVTGRTAFIAGTMKALRKITTAIVSEKAKEDYNNLGYYGNFNGTNIMKIKQVNTVGTYTAKLSDSDIYIVTGEEKPVKFCTEGEAYVVTGDMLSNPDMSQDYFFGTRYGTGTVITDLFGSYAIS